MAMRMLSVGSLPPEWGGSTRGGVATFHQLFLAELASGGHDVDLAGVFPLLPDPASGERPPEDIRLWRQTDGLLDGEWWPQLLDDAAPDVIAFQHIGHRWALHHARQGSDVAAVGTVHSWHQITHAPAERAERARAVLEEVLPAMTRLVFPSDHTRREGLELGFRYSCPAHVIPNHVDPRLLEYPMSRWRSGIAFVGSLERRKRADLVIRAAAALGMPAVIVGKGSQEPRLRRLADELGGRVEFTGEVPPRLVAEVVARSEVLCVPSASESFGNVYAEALALGVPVVGFAPTLAEIADELEVDVGAGVAGDCTADAVGDAVKRVLARSWDGRALRHRVTERLSPRAVVGRYVDVLRSVSEAHH